MRHRQTHQDRSDTATASLWKPGGGKARFRLTNGRTAAEDELSPIARAMLDKNANPDEQWPTHRGFVSDVRPGHEDASGAGNS